MKLTTVASIVNQVPKPVDDLSLVTNQQDWLKTISLGQIIKGKVLKVYDNNRYGVMMGGHERVVDSTILFHVGQQLSVKVVDINGSKVSLKLTERSSHNNTTYSNDSQINHLSIVDSYIKQFNMEQLSAAQKQVIESIASAFNNDVFAIKFALYLAKVGLPVSESLIRNLIKSINTSSQAIDHKMDMPTSLQPEVANDMSALYGAIADALSKERIQDSFDKAAEQDDQTPSMHLGYEPATESKEQDFSFDAESQQAPFIKLLNADTEGVIAHSFDVLTLIINDRLMEFDIAFFDQAKTHTDVTVSKQIVFELETLMGKVGVIAKLINNRLSVTFNSDQAALLNGLQLQNDSFSETLNNAGWTLDQMRYERHAPQTSAVGAIVDHVLAQGSMELLL